MSYCTEHSELVKLCTSCTRKECPENGCYEYKELKKQINIKAGKIKQHPPVKDKPAAMPAMELEIAPAKPVQYTAETLRKCNAAISALEALYMDDGCDMMLDSRRIRALVQYLQEIRMREYAAMINWDSIAETMAEPPGTREENHG